jgi:fibronectin type 3 domain-containing protein
MKVVFTWTYPKDEVPDLAGFNIYRSNEVNTNFKKLNNKVLSIVTSTYGDNVDLPKTYFYYVAAVDYAGNESPSNIVYALVPDIMPPAIPTGLSAVADTTTVTIKWQPNTESDLKGYLIYRVVDHDLKSQVLLNASTIRETQYIDQLAGNTKNAYNYYVISVDTTFNKSKASAFISTVLPDFTSPIKPFIKRISVKDSALFIQWLPAIDQDAAQFMLYRSSETTEESLLATLTADVTGYVDTSAVENIGYDYVLVSMDSSKNRSEQSNTYHGIWSTAAGKSVLADLAISYDSASHKVNLSWAEEQDINGYILYRKKEDSEFKPITGIIKASAYADRTINKGSQYDYRLRSIGNTGIKGESKSITIIIK